MTARRGHHRRVEGLPPYGWSTLHGPVLRSGPPTSRGARPTPPLPGGATGAWRVYPCMGGKPSTDTIISRLASGQHGVVARSQLLAAGVGSRAIDRRLADERLHPVHRGIYLVGHRAPPPLAREAAALLACGPRAVLSHRTAAALWELLPYPVSADVCVTVPGGTRHTRPGLAIVRSTLERRDVRRRRGLRLTSPPRTIVDVAPALDDETLERLVADAEYRRLASEREIRQQLERNPGRPGTPALRALLGMPGGPQRTRSPAERHLLRLLRREGLEGYELNARIHGHEVDVLWRAEGLVLEVDGYDAHMGRIAFERDRLKAATLEAHGVVVMPITPRRLLADPEGVFGRLRAALEMRRGRR
jgi:very-short-patch-repair endonuclease